VRDALRRLTLERALQLAIVATVVTAVLAAGSITAWLETARLLRWPALLALCLLGVVAAARRPDRPALSAVALAAGAFVVLALISVGWSSFPEESAGRAVALVLLFVACGALAHATAGRPDAMRALLYAVLAAAALVALGGLVVLLVDHDRAIQEATTELPARYQGLGGGPNTATMLLAVAMPLAAFARLEARRPWARAVAVGLLVVLAGSIVASGSRGALAAGFGGLLAFAVLVPKGVRSRTLAAAAVVAAAAVGTLAAGIPDPLDAPRAAAAVPAEATPIAAGPGYLDANERVRLQDDVGRPPFGVGDTTRRPRTLLGTSGRAEAWQGALELGATRPVLGFGFGTEGLVFVDRYVGFNSNVPENSYVGLFLQLGLIGLAAFLALVGALLVRTAGVRRLEGGELRIAAAAAGGLVAGLILGLFQSFLYAVGNNATAAVWICAFVLAAATTSQRVSGARA
jgi:O-antigen ligase